MGAVMGEAFQFLLDIGPALVRLVATLFDVFDGDAKAARRNIEDLRGDIERRRAERDQQLDDKHDDGD